MRSDKKTARTVPFRGETVFEVRLLKTLLENSGEGVLLIDHRGLIQRTNQTFSRMSGYAPEMVEGRHVQRFFPDADDRSLLETITRAVWLRGFWQGTVHHRKPSGESLSGSLKVSAVLPDRSRRAEFFVAQFLLETVSPPKNDAIPEVVSGLDPLTGLPGRPLFEDRLSQSLSQARRHGSSVGLMFLDLDRFRVINDSLGIEMGDRVLKAVGKRLADCLRSSDSIARIGADEFAMLLTDIDVSPGAVRNAGFVARKVYDFLSKPVVMGAGGPEVEVSAAIGITLFPQDGDTPDILMRNAETALVHARGKGRNNYQFFSSEMTETARRRFALEASLRHALDREELRVHYQPQLNLKTGRVIGAEALIRWQHPERGMVSPADFIPVAEETGLIVPIGEWVLRKACRQLAEWQRMGLPEVRVGVNLSALQFQRQDLVKIVSDLLTETGIQPRLLDLEITESAIMEDVENVVKILNRISQLGVTLSIDDFGTGYSSLSQLRHFPFRTLKIDRSFVRYIEENMEDVAIVNAIIAMAHSLDQNVIVEGLETEEQLAIMRRLNCNEMQGYLFSAAVPAEELTEMLRDGRRLRGIEDENDPGPDRSGS